MVRTLVTRRIHRTVEPPLDHARIGRRVSAIVRELCGRGRRARICLCLCSDRVIAGINRDWLGRDRATNVIAFPSPAMDAHARARGPLEPGPGVLDGLVPAGMPPVHLGDVVVSVDAAVSEAGIRGRDERIAYLAVHGVLHLLGWDHDDEASWRGMHRTTQRLLRAAPRRGERSRPRAGSPRGRRAS
jgi:probable rRNA maturation factor